MEKYKSETSINKVLADLQLASANIEGYSSEEYREDTFESLIREALQSENEAIKIYIKLADRARELQSSVLIKAFEEIKKDEQEHIGNLNYLLKLLCDKAVEVEAEGETEEAKLQSEISSEEQ